MGTDITTRLLVLTQFPSALATSNSALNPGALTGIIVGAIIGCAVTGGVVAQLCVKRIKAKRHERAMADFEARLQSGEVSVVECSKNGQEGRIGDDTVSLPNGDD